MNIEKSIRISPFRCPGFSRIRRSRQDAPAPAGILPAEAGTPGHFISGLCSKRLSEKLIRGGPTACRVPCDTGQRSRSPGFSRFRPHTG